MAKARVETRLTTADESARLAAGSAGQDRLLEVQA